MPHGASSYPLPQTMEPDLARLHAYWRDLIRGENAMPFSDDINLSQVPELAGRTLLLTAFETPERFRLEHAGERITALYGAALAGVFSDELRQQAPLDSLTEQCRATIQQRTPTYYRAQPENGSGYARLLLPTWGEGHVMLLLGAVTELS